jgi:hypothetical protein
MSCLTETAPWAVRPQEEATFPEPIEVRAMQPSSPADEPPRVQYPISSLQPPHWCSIQCNGSLQRRGARECCGSVSWA